MRVKVVILSELVMGPKILKILVVKPCYQDKDFNTKRIAQTMTVVHALFTMHGRAQAPQICYGHRSTDQPSGR